MVKQVHPQTNAVNLCNGVDTLIWFSGCPRRTSRACVPYTPVHSRALLPLAPGLHLCVPCPSLRPPHLMRCRQGRSARDAATCMQVRALACVNVPVVYVRAWEYYEYGEREDDVNGKQEPGLSLFIIRRSSTNTAMKFALMADIVVLCPTAWRGPLPSLWPTATHNTPLRDPASEAEVGCPSVSSAQTPRSQRPGICMFSNEDRIDLAMYFS